MTSRFATLLRRTTPLRGLTAFMQATLVVTLALTLFAPLAKAQPYIYVED